MYRRFASAPVVEIGLPPNVEIEFARSESTMSSRPTTAPIAIPLPSPFAQTIASGRTP